jgi:hypothetical protein
MCSAQRLLPWPSNPGDMTAPERASRWSRRFVFAAVLALVAWQAGELAGIARRTAVVLGLLGFVFQTVFGKAYSLVPSYFDRDLATTRLMPAQFACSLGGTLALAIDAELDLPAVETAGSLLWVAGVAIFLGTLLWTVRDNLTGGETGTGEVNEHRRRVDRAANLFIPVALAYLAAASYELLALATPLPGLTDGYTPRAFHLLAAGAGALFVFAIGFRLLPRFMVATPPAPLVWLVLPAGAVGPLVLGFSIPSGTFLPVGAVLQALAVGGFAFTVGVMYRRSDRQRVGFYGVLAGAVAGVAAVSLGLVFAFDAPASDLVLVHARLNLLGFLGLTIVGVSYQFYPPTVGTFRGASDRTALAAILLIAGGLAVELGGALVDISPAVTGGQALALVGALAHAYLLGGLFRERFGGR